MTRPCSVCGTPRVVSKGSRPEVVCHECRRARGLVPPSRTREAQREAQRRRRARLHLLNPPRVRVVLPRPCAGCTTEFKPNRNRARYCEACTAVRVWLYGPRPDRRLPLEELVPKRGDHRRRARRFGVAYEPINVRRVYVRDRWRCGLCGHKVDKRLKWPNRMCASLDHVVPMSLGGSHTYDNVHLAHWLCNTLKGTRGGGEQLALIG